MGTIVEIYEALQNLKLREQLPVILKDKGDDVLLLNKKQLFDTSTDSEGEPLIFYSSISYSFEKEKRNPKPGFGRPDLYDTGDFQNGFYLEVKSDSYLIYSRDSKTPDLVGKYGDNVFGLDEPHKQQYVNESIYPGIAAYIKDKTGIVLR